MKNTTNGLRGDEEIVFAMRALYHSHGYTQYRMSRFEPYELYSSNRNFLKDGGIITVNDYGGKLMALKPDVTLSIVKSAAAGHFTAEKVYYDESVYRRQKGSRSIGEMTQVGLECIAAMDLYNTAEVIMLARESLGIISDNYVLDISHMGIISAMLDDCGLEEEVRTNALDCIGKKNVQGLRQLLAGSSASDECAEKLIGLLSVGGAIGDALPVLKGLCHTGAAAEGYTELEGLYSVLKSEGAESGVRLDFSVVNDMDYYNGLMFQGFIEGVPDTVLSGGRYDNLVRKFGCDAGAIGFAVYIDLLERLIGDPEFDVDALLTYDDGISPDAVSKAVRSLREEWTSVRVLNEYSDKITCRRKYRLRAEGLEVIEKND